MADFWLAVLAFQFDPARLGCIGEHIPLGIDRNALAGGLETVFEEAEEDGEIGAVL